MLLCIPSSRLISLIPSSGLSVEKHSRIAKALSTASTTSSSASRRIIDRSVLRNGGRNDSMSLGALSQAKIVGSDPISSVKRTSRFTPTRRSRRPSCSGQERQTAISSSWPNSSALVGLPLATASTSRKISPRLAEGHAPFDYRPVLMSMLSNIFR